MIYEAIQISIEAHKNQFRKLEDGVYVAHPLEVGIILAQEGASDAVIASGILHDTIEDTCLSREDILLNFGLQIADYVCACTEPSKNRPWRERKLWAIDHLKNHATRDIKLIICADKLSNIRSIYRNLLMEGDLVWSKFHAPFEDQKWYYTSMFEGLSELTGLKMHTELGQLIDKVFKE